MNFKVGQISHILNCDTFKYEFILNVRDDRYESTYLSSSNHKEETYHTVNSTRALKILVLTDIFCV